MSSKFVLCPVAVKAIGGCLRQHRMVENHWPGSDRAIDGSGCCMSLHHLRRLSTYEGMGSPPCLLVRPPTSWSCTKNSFASRVRIFCCG